MCKMRMPEFTKHRWEKQKKRKINEQIRHVCRSEVLLLIILIYRFNAMPVKTPADYFAEADKLILKFIYKCKECKITKTITKKINNYSYSKSYYEATVIKAV